MSKHNMLRYQIKNCSKAFIVYYAVLLACTTLLIILSTINFDGEGALVTKGNIYGTEVSTIIFLFVISLCCFSDVFKFFKQVGFNRYDISKSFVSATLVISAIAVCADKVVSLIIRLVTKINNVVDYSTLYELLFAQRVEEKPGILIAVESILFTFMIFVAISFTGRIITNIFFRGNKQLRVLIAAGLPIFVFFLFPIIDNLLFRNKIINFIIDIAPRLLGITNQNPYIGIAVMAIASLVLGLISHRLIARTQIKNR